MTNLDSIFKSRDVTLPAKVRLVKAGAFFGNCLKAQRIANDKLRHAAGNYYVNDKPTGAVVGMQPFGGARASGTNDKAGGLWNLIRWTSPRAIKNTFVPAAAYGYPFLAKD